MSKPQILLDTGPLVALLSPTDSNHARALSAWDSLSPPLLTCWPVLTEAAWLLRGQPAAVERMFSSASAGLYRIAPMDEQDAAAVAAILKRHRRLRPQLADACLVRLSHRENISAIFTFDQRDFRVYRAPGNKAFHILPD